MSGGSDIAAQAPLVVSEPPAGGLHRRLDWIDALKGIGIVAVVAGHVWTRGPVRDAIYLVHMPLFFILSGYTARHMPWGKLLPGSLRSLGLPFLCFSILLIGADFLIEGLRGVRPIFASWLQAAGTILFATEKLRGPFTILWFIPCLFLARLIWNALVAKDRRADAWPVLAAMALVGGLAMIAHLGTASPLAVLAVPGALLMIWAGALWRLWGSPQRALMIILAGLAVAGLVWLPPVNMKLGHFGMPFLSLGAAVAATVTLGRLVQGLPALAMAALASLGRASLVIMYVHVAFIHYLAPYAPRLALFVVALSVSLLIDRMIRHASIARRLLLGEAKNLG